MHPEKTQNLAGPPALPRRTFLQRAGRSVIVLSGLRAIDFASPVRAVAVDDVIKIADPTGVLGETGAPVAIECSLPAQLRAAFAAGRLGLVEPGNPEKEVIPAQRLPGGTETTARLCWLMSAGPAGERSFRLTDARLPLAGRMDARAVGGQYELTERDKPVLRYNYATIEPGELLKSVSADNRKYAVARSDYIHPLYGLEGEVLTKDWSVDHPHHRGIYWAWPEVDWQGKRGDLHALQNVFARPVGKCEVFSGPVFCGVSAENVWRWEDREPVVRERAVIRAYRSGALGRVIDLEFTFEAIDLPVQVARRGTNAYGGLNIRLSAIAGQQFKKYTAPAGSNPRPSWSDASGSFAGAQKPSGLVVMQMASNHDYPGDWIDFPDMNWLQPTFPASGTRFELKKGNPLTLRFRLWIHSGGPVSETSANACWQAAHSSFSTLTSKTPSAL